MLAPDEVFLQTVLVGSRRFTVVNDSERYFDFRNSKGNHPKVLGAQDMARIEVRGAHFARKVDQRVDARLMDLLDERVLTVKHLA